MYEILMPKLGMDMTEGKINRWLISEGAIVKKGDPVVEIETDKTVMELEAGESGVLKQITVKEDSIVPPGEVLGIIE
ncbi:MAG TPA: biotin/lipoyl-containing protein [bacterium]|nr:biotin/lipoyl-containing protein [bacterium]